MSDCIFCKIAAGEIPSYKIYEDEDYLAFLDINPIVEGHTLVIPKKHYRWVWDVENIGRYFEVCQKIARHYQKVTGKELVMSQTIGNEVPHPHVHIYPDLNSGDTDGVLAAFANQKKPKLEDHKARELEERLRLPR